jgi:hypothetical protein
MRTNGFHSFWHSCGVVWALAQSFFFYVWFDMVMIPLGLWQNSVFPFFNYFNSDGFGKEFVESHLNSLEPSPCMFS